MVPLTYVQVAKLIDHSLLHPTMTDEQVQQGLELAAEYGVATACVKPYSIGQAMDALSGSGVDVCAVIGFPHGNSTSRVKVLETRDALEHGATEIDMVINIGKAMGGDFDYVAAEIQAIQTECVQNQALLKVIFENDFLDDETIVRLCQICTDAEVAFIKTSTGYGFVKQPNGDYNYRGATPNRLKLMREHAGPMVQIKAAGGIRTLDELFAAYSLGATRIGASATASILNEYRARYEGADPIDASTPSGY